jgi:hypothetical protein
LISYVDNIPVSTLTAKPNNCHFLYSITKKFK